MNKKFDIGIIGGGQLGKMLIEEGLRYNVTFATLDPEENSPASKISQYHITGSLQDVEKIKELVAISKVTTYEIEHINIEVLLTLEQEGHQLFPSPKILEIVQDKGLQKDFYKNNNIATAPYIIVQNKSEWLPALQNLKTNKFAAKLCKGGYDGKGVVLLNTADIINNNVEIPFDTPTVLEAFVESEKEISVIIARDNNGKSVCFDAVEMEFDAKANLVTYLKCPAVLQAKTKQKAFDIATQVIDKMNGIGIFAIEMFVTPDQTIIVNEMAPRPHNSGHHSIEACYTSQYEQLIRILLHKPLGSTAIIQASAMMNILGAPNFSGAYKLKHEQELLATEGVYIHLYGKAESKPMRKLGHVTVMAKSESELKEKAELVMSMLALEKI